MEQGSSAEFIHSVESVNVSSVSVPAAFLGPFAQVARASVRHPNDQRGLYAVVRVREPRLEGESELDLIAPAWTSERAAELASWTAGAQVAVVGREWSDFVGACLELRLVDVAHALAGSSVRVELDIAWARRLSALNMNVRWSDPPRWWFDLAVTVHALRAMLMEVTP